MAELSGRSLTLAYMAALAVVALLSLASHVTLDHILRAHEGAASVINVSGRQRMLSQRIAGLAAQAALGIPEAKQDLLAASEEFEKAHRALLLGSEKLHLPAANSPEVRAIYFGGSHPLDAAVGDFLARARSIAAMTADDPGRITELKALFAEAREPILTDLNAVVSVHQRDSERQLAVLERMQTGSLIVIIITLVSEALLIFRPMVLRIARYTRDLMTLAATDPLTGALNRRSFNERAAAELARARRYGRPTSLLAIDADRFKAINDTYGHGGGDAVLQELVKAVAGCLRGSDLLGRMGGEEFAVLLAETGIAGAETAAERIRATVAALEVATEAGPVRFTVSIGASQCAETDLNVERAMGEADAALYKAKANGRNRVVTARPPAAPAVPSRSDPVLA